MGYELYKFSNVIKQKDTEISELKQEKQTMQNTLNDIQATLNNSINTSNEKTDKEKAEEIANKFIDAVNNKDTEALEEYSDAGVVSTVEKYNITNIKLIELSRYIEEDDEYIYDISFDFNYNGITNQEEVSLGNVLILKKENDKFLVTAVGATGI